jgi:hypothetical protein
MPILLELVARLMGRGQRRGTLFLARSLVNEILNNCCVNLRQQAGAREELSLLAMGRLAGGTPMQEKAERIAAMVNRAAPPQVTFEH